MAERSDEIRDEIEGTRERVGDTVDALAYKANVPTRTKDWVTEKKDAVVSKVGGATSAVSDRAPDREQVTQQAGRLKQTAEHNPIGLAIAGAAVGFLAGLLLPNTRAEDERFGTAAETVRTKAAEAGQEALERGKQVAQDAAQAAAETAKEQGREQGQELSSTVQEKAKDAASGTSEEVRSRSQAGEGKSAP